MEEPLDSSKSRMRMPQSGSWMRWCGDLMAFFRLSTSLRKNEDTITRSFPSWLVSSKFSIPFRFLSEFWILHFLANQETDKQVQICKQQITKIPFSLLASLPWSVCLSISKLMMNPEHQRTHREWAPDKWYLFCRGWGGVRSRSPLLIKIHLWHQC